MVNKITGKRELSYVVTIDKIEPIEGSDNCEAAIVGGWKVMVKENTFKAGDLAIYFEIDSKVNTSLPEFTFLEKYHGHVKTQRYTFGGKNPGFYSQGLLMHPSDFGWKEENHKIVTPAGDLYSNGDFLTEKLNVTYYNEADQKRKNPSVDKYSPMIQRNNKLFKKKPYSWLIKREWGKKLLFIFFGKKRDTIPTHFPSKFNGVSKTDSERVENMPWILNYKDRLIQTTKIDGTSSTFILEKKPFGKYEYYVCSRNVRQLTPEQDNWHSNDENVYWEVSDKFHIKEFLKYYIEQNGFKWAAIQGETAGLTNNGAKIQGNPHKFDTLRFFAFDLINSKDGKINPVKGAEICKAFNIEWVPIVSTSYVLPDTMEEFKAAADGNCEAPGASGLREGYVYRKALDPTFNFKNVSNKYLMKKGE